MKIWNRARRIQARLWDCSVAGWSQCCRSFGLCRVFELITLGVAAIRYTYRQCSMLQQVFILWAFAHLAKCVARSVEQQVNSF